MSTAWISFLDHGISNIISKLNCLWLYCEQVILLKTSLQNGALDLLLKYLQWIHLHELTWVFCHTYIRVTQSIEYWNNVSFAWKWMKKITYIRIGSERGCRSWLFEHKPCDHSSSKSDHQDWLFISDIFSCREIILECISIESSICLMKIGSNLKSSEFGPKIKTFSSGLLSRTDSIIFKCNAT